VDVTTGASERLMENTQFSEVYADAELALRYAAKQTADGGQEYFVKVGDEWQSWLTVPQEDSLTTALAGITTDGTTLYMLDSRERDTGALFAVDVDGGERDLLHEDARADVTGAILHPATRRVQAVAVNYLRNEWTVLDPSIEGDLANLRRIAGDDGEFAIVSRTQADDRWVVAVIRSDESVKYYLYDRG